MVLRRIKVREHERGLLFRDREFERILPPGRHWVWDPRLEVQVDVVSVRDVWLDHKDLDVIAKAGALGDEARIVDLKDHERAIVWVDGRIEAVLKPGLYALWTVFHAVRVEKFDARVLRFEHVDLAAIAKVRGAAPLLEAATIEAGHAGLFFKDGRHEATLAPGPHAFWKDVAKAHILDVDLREQVVDVAGQEIMTADKVTLRLNAVVTYKVADPVKAVTTVEDYRQALYREAHRECSWCGRPPRGSVRWRPRARRPSRADGRGPRRGDSGRRGARRRRARPAVESHPGAMHHGRGDRVVERRPWGCRTCASGARRARGSGASPCPRRAPLRRAAPRSRPGAGRRRPSRGRGSAVTSATPSAIASRSQSVRSCSVSGISSPFGPGPRRPPGIGQQHERQQPGDLAVVGQQMVDRAGRAGSPRARGRCAAGRGRCCWCSPR